MYEKGDLEMEKTPYLPSTTVKLEALLAKWARVITALVSLCAVVAIVLGIIWLFLKKDTLLFTTLGFFILITRNGINLPEAGLDLSRLQMV
jgi:hypothetical protein